MRVMPATPADLINVDEVIGKYYDLVPDPERPRAACHPSAPPATADRPLKTSFNEAHIVAITQAIAEYRKKAGSQTGPLYLGSRHPRAVRARPGRPPSRCSSPTACTVRVDSRDDFAPDPGGLPGHPDPQPRGRRHPALRPARASPTASSSPRPTTRPPTAASSTTPSPAARLRPTTTNAIAARANEQPRRLQQPHQARARTSRPSSPTCVERFDFREHYVADLENVIDIRGDPSRRRAPRRRTRSAARPSTTGRLSARSTA